MEGAVAAGREAHGADPVLSAAFDEGRMRAIPADTGGARTAWSCPVRQGPHNGEISAHLLRCTGACVSKDTT
jgi:hypothetical protein